ncbi:restriction endonuclease subunit S [Methylomonas sp. SURF-2]|uniref:Restriction endonuclease subunit S n=1 Tax=Methylomonas subterranea TaxID=2952225 RepID=A0ABT1TG26_9GAMM|nr:restriction endonuclease subunit S [Methylomonas sp. SURF-2]MCQ8104206.1 restriction endonuclease subunit S [Methylomonas sp. SURF-2]
MNLPEGWALSEIGELGEIITGKTPSTKVPENFGGSIPFIKPGDLDHGGYIHFTADTLTELGLKSVPKLPPHSITVTCIGNLGKIGITTTESATNQQINSVVPSRHLNYKFLYHYLATLKPWLEQEASATTVAIINKGKFSKAPIKVAPLAEQHQIAAKLDELLAQVDSIKTRLDAIPNILKRFRQSVLAAAVSGKLTEDWRNDHSEFGEWKAINFGNLILDSGNGISKRSGNQGRDVTVLRLADFKNAMRVHGNERKITLTEKEIQKYRLENGDLLVVRVNGSVEIAGLFIVYDGNDTEAYCDHFIRFSIDHNKALSKFITYITNEGEGRKYLRNSLSTSAGQNTINQKSINALQFRLPSLLEQTEIVHRVEQLFTYADHIEQRVKDSQSRVKHLTQSILAKAFRGELTADWRSQNPDLINGENGAEALLARIQAGRVKEKPKPKLKKKLKA